MKDKILTLIIGILIGAIIASTGFIIYIKTNNKGRKHDFGAPPQMNQSQNSSQNRDTPPEMPSGNNSSQNSGTPPEFPNGEAPNKNNDNLTSTQNNDQIQSNT